MIKEFIKAFIAKRWCLHKWKKENEVKVYDPYHSNKDIPVAYKFHYICEKCGEMKEVKL